MRMDEFMTALQSKLDTLQPNYPDNAENILEVCSMPITNPAASITQPSKPTLKSSTGL